jgi:hypothetical protein
MRAKRISHEGVAGVLDAAAAALGEKVIALFTQPLAQ